VIVRDLGVGKATNGVKKRVKRTRRMRFWHTPIFRQMPNFVKHIMPIY
jgi:hypothetical protein